MHFKTITRENWEAASRLRPKRSQYGLMRRDVVLHSLARCYVQAEKPDKFVPYVIVHEGQFIGAFLFRNYGRGCNLTSFFIDRKHQGKGLGRKALLHLIDWVKEHYPKAGEIETAVLKDNAVARHLYESLGFQYTGVENAGGTLDMELQFE